MNKIGIIGSPSSTREIIVDITDGAETTPLYGQLVTFALNMRNYTAIALAVITRVKTTNIWHEDAHLRGVIKKSGNLPNLTGEDTRVAELDVQAVFQSDIVDPSVGAAPIELGAVLPVSPTTGTPVYRVTDSSLNRVLLRGRSDETTFLGTISGMPEVRAPFLLRDFQRDSAGEAPSFGIFGLPGSGKSGLATYMVAGLMRNPNLAVLMVDPKGQFTSEYGLPFSLQGHAAELGRKVRTVNIFRDTRLPKTRLYSHD